MISFNLLPSLHPASWTPALFGRSVARASSTSQLLGVILGWQERADQRHQLEAADDRLLADMGLERGLVAREVRKSFWQA